MNGECRGRWSKKKRGWRKKRKVTHHVMIKKSLKYLTIDYKRCTIKSFETYENIVTFESETY